MRTPATCHFGLCFDAVCIEVQKQSIIYLTGALTMNQGIQTIIYPVKDLTKAKAQFTELLEVEPYVDAPYYVGFKVGNQDIGLDPSGHQAGATAFYHVSDIKGSFQKLLDAG